MVSTIKLKLVGERGPPCVTPHPALKGLKWAQVYDGDTTEGKVQEALSEICKTGAMKEVGSGKFVWTGNKNAFGKKIPYYYKPPKLKWHMRLGW